MVVAEFDKRGGFIKRLDYSADMPTDKSVPRKVTKRDCSENVAGEISSFGNIRHPKTQRVANRRARPRFERTQTILTATRRC
jgi:hypothetical protein